MLRKYTLCLAGLLGLLLGNVGCGGPHHHTGYLAATWTIVDSRTGLQGDCQWAGISEVELAARDVYTGIDYIRSYVCTAYQGLSDPLPESEYAVALYGYSPRVELVTQDVWVGTTFPVYWDATTPVPGILEVPYPYPLYVP